MSQLSEFPGNQRREILKSMIMNLRVAELQILLQQTKHNKTGKKHILQERALSLLDKMSNSLADFISELHKKRYSSFKPLAYLSATAPDLSFIKDAHSLVNPIDERSMNLPFGLHRISVGHSMRQTVANDPAPVSTTNEASETSQYPNTELSDHVTISNIRRVPKVIPSPFFDVTRTVIPPTIYNIDEQLLSEPSDQRTEFCDLNLNIEDINLLSLNRKFSVENDSYEYEYTLQLRLCKLPEDDFLPMHFSIRLNDDYAKIPDLVAVPKLGGLFRRAVQPIYLLANDRIRLNPNKTNKLEISWSKDDAIGFAVYLGKIVSANILAERIKHAREPCSEMDSLKLVLEKFKENSDDEIMATTLRASLDCPLAKCLIQLPCRAKSCTHVQCFDGNSFLSLNEKKEAWICPVCDCPIKYNDIHVDELWMKILGKVPADCHEIEFNPDGSWTYVTIQEKLVLNASLENDTTEIITIDSDCEMPSDHEEEIIQEIKEEDENSENSFNENQPGSGGMQYNAIVNQQIPVVIRNGEYFFALEDGEDIIDGNEQVSNDVLPEPIPNGVGEGVSVNADSTSAGNEDSDIEVIECDDEL